MIRLFTIPNIKEEYNKWNNELNGIFKQTEGSRYWPLRVFVPTCLGMLFVLLCCIFIIKEFLGQSETGIDLKNETSLLTAALILSMVINCAAFLNSLVIDNGTGILVKVITWILEKFRVPEEWILNITIAISFLITVQLVNGGITEGFLMMKEEFFESQHHLSNTGFHRIAEWISYIEQHGFLKKNEGEEFFESQHYLSLIILGLTPINNWLGHAFYSVPEKPWFMYSSVNKTASLLSSFITLASLIEKMGRNWTYTKELLLVCSLAIKIIQLSIIIGHALMLIINQEKFAKIENTTVTLGMSTWMLFYSVACLVLISCRGNNILILMGMYSPLLIVFVTIYCWDHVMKIGLEAQTNQN